MLDDPEKYGFMSPYEVCNRTQCIWFDNFHPGSAFYKFLAEDLAVFLKERGTWKEG